MATEVRETRNNTGLWIALAVIAILAIIVIAWMATARPANERAEFEPNPTAPIVLDSGSASQAASDAARSAEMAAERAAESAGEAARNVGDAARDAAAGVRAEIPAGDARITVDAPAT